MSLILSEEKQDFEIIVVAPPKPKFELSRDKIEALNELLDSMDWDKRKFKRYVNAALRLRKIEKEAGRSYLSLLRSYKKLSSEEIKLRYSIEQLKEKRRKIEEDLKLYMDQYQLTLDLVQKISKLVSALRERGLDLDDLESGLNVLESLRKLDHDPSKILEELKKHEDLMREVEDLRSKTGELRLEIRELEQRRLALLDEIRRIHEIEGGLNEIKEELEKLRNEREEIKHEIEEQISRLKSVKNELEELMGFKATIENLKETVEQLRAEIENLRGEESKLRSEIAELLGVRAEAEEISNGLKAAREELERLEKMVESKKSYVELVEGEDAAAYAILKIFSDPSGVEAEDLEALAEQLKSLAKVKKGEVSVLRPLEPHLLERVRQSIINLIMPYVRKEFVPRKAFERIESELRRLSERRTALEAEIESLRKALKSRMREKVEVFQMMEVEAVSPTNEVIKLKTIEDGMKVKVVCPSCGTAIVTRIPTIEELEELQSNDYKLRFTCGACGKSFEIRPEIVLKRIRR
ncbi:MAG: hypothetical protein DRN49_01555 [Thaumarchaeota archaeon]|nr:MAG: hypothetical protein DRN49_01555 [Nitrososphaerota archaeon]